MQAVAQTTGRVARPPDHAPVSGHYHVCHDRCGVLALQDEPHDGSHRRAHVGVAVRVQLAVEAVAHGRQRLLSGEGAK